ncbi:rap guanine nucleotide exchange factor 6-like isoform X1 [Montipora foliosa]|uniref:rap guanine nucleotide exchange factor 6-like isoform X1 n=1 Tax=Montipora foliosa TaxID=591990 RepID=UPI0035F1A629
MYQHQIMAFGENLNNNSQFINCLRKPVEHRTNEDVETIFCYLCGMQAMAGLPQSAVRTMSETARYVAEDSNHLLYMADDLAQCWYVLLSGCVFLDGCMYLPGSSFGKQPLGTNRKRGTDCLVLEYSEMIVIDFPSTDLFQPFQRHSYSKNDLERLLALETEDYRIGGPIPDDEQLPMELQHVKEIILRSDQQLKRSASVEGSHSGNNLELDLTGLVESIVDSDEEDEEEESHSSRESLMVRDVVRDCLEKEPSDRTESDIQALLDFMQHLPAFANMTMNVRQELCAVMVFAVVDKAGSTVMANKEELDSWCVILNGSVEILVDGAEPVTLHLGDSFGVEPTLKKMYHNGVMKTRVDDCQFVCVAQADYYRILTQGERSIQCIEENGSVVMVTEFRKTDGGSRQGQVVIKATPLKLISHVIADHSAIDPTFVEDLLLTYKTFLDRSSEICSQLLNWFLERRFRDKVTRAMLLWVNNHYGDFEGDPVMEDYLGTFEKGLELQQMNGQLGLLNIACAAKAKSRRITMDRSSREMPLGFTISGGREYGFGIFISKVEPESKALEAGLRRGDKILEGNGTNFGNITYVKARDVLSSSIHVSLLVKRNMQAFKEMLTSPQGKDNLRLTQTKDTVVQRSSSDCSERNRTLQTRLSVPDITSDPSKRQVQHLHPSSTTERVKKALNRLSVIGTLSRNTKLISRSERDLLSMDHDSTDEMHVLARHPVKKQRVSLPRGFGSTECIYTSEQNGDMPDKVIKVYKADQTCKYFMVYKETTAREVVNRALDAFGIQDSASNYSLCEITVEDEGFIKQRRLPDMLHNLSDRIHLNGRYYLKNNLVSGSLLPDEAAQELAKEANFSLLQLKPRDLAKEITLQDFEVFRSIDPREYIYKLWNFGPKLTENLRKFSEIVNKEMFWVVTEICNESNLVKRMKIIKTFIKIARLCKECKNYNTLFAIVSGLGHSAVRRLKNTWDKLPTRHSKAFEDLQSLMDPSRNMSKYRNLLNGEHGEPPLIPFFPVITKDLTFIHLGNDSIVDGLVNFEKLRLIAREIRQISKFNSIPYDPETMFEEDPNSQGGPGQQKVTSTVVGMVTGSSNRRSLRDQNPKKMYEESMMSRRVKQYLSGLTIIQDEEKLRDMSNACEPPQGSAPPSVQTRKKNSPTSSPVANPRDRKGSKPHELTVPSPLALKKDLVGGDRISVSSTASSSSLAEPDVQSPKLLPEDEVQVFPENDRTSFPEDTVHMQELRRLHINDEHRRPHYRHPPTLEVIRPLHYSASAESLPYSSNHSTSSQDHSYHPGVTYQYNAYHYPTDQYSRVEYVENYDEEGQVSAV